MHKAVSAVLLSLATLPVVGSEASATPSIFEFNQLGYSDGGVFSGFFEGEDINNDGQIVSFDGEITDFSATYQSGQAFFTFDFSSLEFPEFDDLTGLVYSLDGGGTIGDDTRGAIEGLAVSSFDGYMAIGPGPADICDGFLECGFASFRDFTEELGSDGELVVEDVLVEIATTSQVINVTSGPLGDAFGSPERPFLPDPFVEGPEDGFVFDIRPDEIEPGVTFFFDPIVAVGYVYEITGTEFASVTAPTFAQVPDADGQYMLELPGLAPQLLLAGETITFDTPVTTFTITGIDTALELDPNDPAAFITGVTVSSQPLSNFVIQQTPITVDTSPIPLPAGGVLLLTGLTGLYAARRKRKHVMV